MTNSKKEERRSAKRIKKSLHLQCGPWNKAGVWSSVIMKDLSENGICFLSNREFSVDEMLEIRLSTFLRSRPISIICKVIDSKKQENGRNWITRTSIAQIHEEDSRMFREIIQAYLQGSGDN